MRNLMISIALFVFGVAIAPVISSPANAQTEAASTKMQAKPFVKKKKSIKGQWQFIQREGKTYIAFDDAFKTSKGPDLKVFLSPQTISEVNGDTATMNALNLGELISHKGAQMYKIPTNTDISKFKSVLIHCEAYSILWGGSDL